MPGPGGNEGCLPELRILVLGPQSRRPVKTAQPVEARGSIGSGVWGAEYAYYLSRWGAGAPGRRKAVLGFGAAAWRLPPEAWHCGVVTSGEAPPTFTRHQPPYQHSRATRLGPIRLRKGACNTRFPKSSDVLVVQTLTQCFAAATKNPRTVVWNGELRVPEESRRPGLSPAPVAT